MPTVRRLRPSSAELARVDALLMEAYESPSRRSELELYLRLQPDGWFVVEDEGEIVAVAGCVRYGPLAWLGLVATARRTRGRGLATLVSRRLLDWAAVEGCRTVALDASAPGRPVYERLGFEALGETVELVAGDHLAGPRTDAGTAREPVALDELRALDRRVFGADRGRVLELLVGSERLPCLTTRAADGSLSGFLVVRGAAVGPGVALGPDDARALVLRAFADRSSGARLLVPMESEHLGTLRALGLVERRRLTHMRHGRQDIPGERSRLLAQLSFAAG
jgi:GNAT superfamily N-acetyltransferase